MEKASFGEDWGVDEWDETITGLVMYIRQKSAATAVLAESSQG